ncbi:MAG: hypothetical protein ACLGHA_07270 [Gammaproteobacteria bacterium]
MRRFPIGLTQRSGQELVLSHAVIAKNKRRGKPQPAGRAGRLDASRARTLRVCTMTRLV